MFLTLGMLSAAVNHSNCHKYGPAASLSVLGAEPVIPGCFSEMSNGSMTVRAASVFTWVCQQGECRASPPSTASMT